MDMLFPPGKRTRAPLISITGSCGKAEAVRLMRHCLTVAGYHTGVASSEGLFISGRALKSGDQTDPEAVRQVLRESTIDCAVLETPVEAILKGGLGYEYADVALVLNLHPREIDCDYANAIEDMAYAKSTVAEQVYDDGYCILNADAMLVMEMAERTPGQLVLFSKDLNQNEVGSHLRRGRTAVGIDGAEIVICKGENRQHVAVMTDIPILKDPSQVDDRIDLVLGSIAALHLFGLPITAIRMGLERFDMASA